jgi:hypothetical protein
MRFGELLPSAGAPGRPPASGIYALRPRGELRGMLRDRLWQTCETMGCKEIATLTPSARVQDRL